MLICKISSRSLLNLNDENVVSIFDYCIKLFDTKIIRANELQIILTISKQVFDNFKKIGNKLVSFFRKIFNFKFYIKQRNNQTIFDIINKSF